MAIHCPYCQFLMELKGVRPGRFTPKCGKCGGQFVLTVAAESDPVVEPLHVFDAAPIESETAAPAAAPPARPHPVPQPQSAPPPAPHHPHAAPPPAHRAVAAAIHHAARTPAAPPRPPAARPIVPQSDLPLPTRLGDYELTKALGRGGMGCVYLAHQVSRDRDVAVKVMNTRWAKDPEFVSRFTREAYAAAQLNHHHLVQIHDIAQHNDQHYISMEYVPGQTLAERLTQGGPLPVEEAVGYVLQAARGLKFAHDRRRIHRDVKPENLLLSSDGIVKVADMGLVKAPGAAAAGRSDLDEPISADDAKQTMADVSVGTPAYMAPEQARDASKIDSRADIYALGCTLYALLTGRPPFEGATVGEILAKHADQPVTPPENIVPDVPPAVSAIVQKMMAKDPDRRHQDMEDVIRALEAFLGVEDAGSFTPRDEHVRVLESAVVMFNGVNLVRIRRWLIRGFFLLCAAATFSAAINRRPLLAGGILGLAALTPLFYQLLVGITRKTTILARVRQWLLDGGIGQWLKIILVALVGVILLVLLNLHWVWLGWSIVALSLAVIFHFLIDRLVEQRRQPEVASVRDMLRTMRLAGLDEDTLRQFVCKYSGPRWEEFYETLFGYDAKMEARHRWGHGEQGRPRRKYAAWRDRVIQWIDARELARKAASDHAYLFAVEEKKLKARGYTNADARDQAQYRANRIMEKAQRVRREDPEWRKNMELERAIRPRGVTAEILGVAAAATAEEARQAAHREKMRQRWSRQHQGLSNFLLGSRARCVVGLILLFACLWWMNQNSLMPGQDLPNFAQDAWRDASHARISDAALSIVSTQNKTQPLRLPLAPPQVTALFNSFLPGIAGLLLILSAVWRGPTMGLFMFPAAAAIWLIPILGLPVIGKPVDMTVVGFALGGFLGLLGLLLARQG